MVTNGNQYERARCQLSNTQLAIATNSTTPVDDADWIAITAGWLEPI
jgi:hypothetical protein